MTYENKFVSMYVTETGGYICIGRMKLCKSPHVYAVQPEFFEMSMRQFKFYRIDTETIKQILWVDFDVYFMDKVMSRRELRDPREKWREHILLKTETQHPSKATWLEKKWLYFNDRIKLYIARRREQRS